MSFANVLYVNNNLFPQKFLNYKAHVEITQAQMRAAMMEKISSPLNETISLSDGTTIRDFLVEGRQCNTGWQKKFHPPLHEKISLSRGTRRQGDFLVEG